MPAVAVWRPKQQRQRDDKEVSSLMISFSYSLAFGEMQKIQAQWNS